MRQSHAYCLLSTVYGEARLAKLTKWLYSPSFKFFPLPLSATCPTAGPALAELCASYMTSFMRAQLVDFCTCLGLDTSGSQATLMTHLVPVRRSGVPPTATPQTTAAEQPTTLRQPVSTVAPSITLLTAPVPAGIPPAAGNALLQPLLMTLMPPVPMSQLVSQHPPTVLNTSSGNTVPRHWPGSSLLLIKLHSLL